MNWLRAGLISGTPQYIAPEQIRTPDQIDFRADMYCLGATLFHAATGHPPFTCDTLDEMLNAHLSSYPTVGVGADSWVRSTACRADCSIAPQASI
jgi:serine/threonine protein kinase